MHNLSFIHMTSSVGFKGRTALGHYAIRMCGTQGLQKLYCRAKKWLNDFHFYVNLASKKISLSSNFNGYIKRSPGIEFGIYGEIILTKKRSLDKSISCFFFPQSPKICI